MKHRPVYACEVQGSYHDTGSKVGWLEANLTFALKRKDMATEARAMLKRLPR